MMMKFRFNKKHTIKYITSIYFFISILIFIFFIIMSFFNRLEILTTNSKILFIFAQCSLLSSIITSYIYLYIHRRKYIINNNDIDKQIIMVSQLNIYLLVIGIICMLFSFFKPFYILVYVSISLMFISVINILYIINLYTK